MFKIPHVRFGDCPGTLKYPYTETTSPGLPRLSRDTHALYATTPLPELRAVPVAMISSGPPCFALCSSAATVVSSETASDAVADTSKPSPFIIRSMPESPLRHCPRCANAAGAFQAKAPASSTSSPNTILATVASFVSLSSARGTPVEWRAPCSEYQTGVRWGKRAASCPLLPHYTGPD